MSERHLLDPTPELPNDTPIVLFPMRIYTALGWPFTGGLTFVEVQRPPDANLSSNSGVPEVTKLYRGSHLDHVGANVRPASQYC